MDHTFKIGLTGGSGSGKTSFIRDLAEKLGPDKLCIISQDDYYLPIEQQPKDAKGIENFDLPESIDYQAFVEDLQRLDRGESVSRTEYTFNNPEAEAATITFEPAPILLIEGIFAMHREEIREMLDLTLFIHAPEYIRLKRRLKRDTRDRGYDFDDVLYRFEHHVMPTHERYIEPFREKADLVINNTHKYKKSLKMLAGFLKHKLRKQGKPR